MNRFSGIAQPLAKYGRVQFADGQPFRRPGGGHNSANIADPEPTILNSGVSLFSRLNSQQAHSYDLLQQKGGSVNQCLGKLNRNSDLVRAGDP